MVLESCLATAVMPVKQECKEASSISKVCANSENSCRHRFISEESLAVCSDELRSSLFPARSKLRTRSKSLYCTADKTQDKVLAYVSQSQFNETLECQAFLCQQEEDRPGCDANSSPGLQSSSGLWEIAQEDKSKKARTCCSCSVSDGQTETTNTHCVSDSEKHQPLEKEEKLRRPFFSMSFSSPRNKPTRKRPIKHDSWDVEDGLDDAFSR
ncbi:low density lipoprotein receptor adapter protein 1-like [Salvelinus sp. IW2-2015]|uniref:low density lipoprotein receptor adapter protein 1-like n=1 Tax=Salvelinus sp. IW2-2015 TaxID=2691554 RepID=UPI0038D5144E